MDNEAFDSVARSLGTAGSGSTSRRGMTRLLGGLALGAPLALLGMPSVDANEAKCKKKCGPCKRCKKGTCKAKPAGSACAGGTCQGGRCVPANDPPPPLVCPSGTFTIAGRCAPTCGPACAARGGACAVTIEGFTYCAPNIAACTAVPQACGSHAGCGAQELCAGIGCDNTVVNRCIPFLF
jgi:hypothetical protein